MEPISVTLTYLGFDTKQYDLQSPCLSHIIETCFTAQQSVLLKSKNCDSPVCSGGWLTKEIVLEVHCHDDTSAIIKPCTPAI